MNVRDEISLGSIYIGTLIGAGFASGQEIMNFFTVYGKQGLLGIIMASILFFILGYFIFRESIRSQSQCVRDILLPVAGKTLMFFFDILVDIFCLAGYYIMLSGSGAVLSESMSLNYMWMIVLLSILIISCLKREVRGLADFNKLMVTIMIIITFLIGFVCFKNNPGIFRDTKILSNNKKGWFISSIIYVSYNITLALVVLASLGTYTTKPSVALGAAAIGSSGLMVMAILIWFITWANYESLFGVQIPLLWVAQQNSQVLYLTSIVVLLSAMLSTAIGLGFSFTRGISRRLGIKYQRALNFLFIGIPLTKYSFTGLIKQIYPLFGIIGIFFGILLVIRRFLSIKRE
ncbi:MAG TPA: hypothetical protein GXZ27_13215 [Thermoanaerobacterales bacterium]|nr:hypothetical protein [Thermoanaerobacterales bacterium]